MNVSEGHEEPYTLVNGHVQPIDLKTTGPLYAPASDPWSFGAPLTASDKRPERQHERSCRCDTCWQDVRDGWGP